MAKIKLVIVESPAKAKTIEKYLGGNYKVIASLGHIRDLPKKELGIDLDSFDTKLVNIDGKEETIKKIIELGKNAEEIFLASDPDREGEAIAFHLRDILKRKDSHRVLFNEITKNEILKAIANPLKLDEKKYEAQQTRRLLDRIVGYKISPILWKKLQKGLSAGRVQSVALRIIVEREEEILAFVPEKSFQITATLEKENTAFEAKYYGDLTKKIVIKEESLALKILEDIDTQKFKVVSAESKDKLVKPTPPFTTSKLQQEAAYKLGWASKKTMQVAQKLYEGIEISEKGRQGLITYMRTDSVRSSPEAVALARTYIKDNYGDKYLPSKEVVHDKKSGGAKTQDAHEAIRPTNIELSPDSIRADLDHDQYKLYDLIWKKFLASQMSSSEVSTTTYIFDCKGHEFRSSGSVQKFDGFKKVFEDSKGKKNNELTLPVVLTDEELDQKDKARSQEKFTTPPARFNDGTLIEELEKKGIGRPSTYSAIISNISDRMYVQKNKEMRYAPTELGSKLCTMLRDNFPVQMDIKFTSDMESKLDDIENGTEDYKNTLKLFWQQLKTEIDKTEEALPDIPRDIKPEEKTDIKCTKCSDGYYVVKKMKSGAFLGCSNYPNCKSTQDFSGQGKNIKIVEKKKNFSDIDCPKCSKKMVIIKTKDSKFLSCQDHPTCKTTMPIPSKIPGICKKGVLIKRTSKAGKDFWTCTACDEIHWNPPLNQPCEKCQHPWVEEITFKKEKEKKVFCICPSCKNKQSKKIIKKESKKNIKK